MLKMLLKTDSKCTENVVWLKCISKQIYFKTDKSDVTKQIVSKQIHFKMDRKNNQTGRKCANQRILPPNTVMRSILNLLFFFFFGGYPFSILE